MHKITGNIKKTTKHSNVTELKTQYKHDKTQQENEYNQCKLQTKSHLGRKPMNKNKHSMYELYIIQSALSPNVLVSTSQPVSFSCPDKVFITSALYSISPFIHLFSPRSKKYTYFTAKKITRLSSYVYL